MENEKRTGPRYQFSIAVIEDADADLPEWDESERQRAFQERQLTDAGQGTHPERLTPLANADRADAQVAYVAVDIHEAGTAGEGEIHLAWPNRWDARQVFSTFS